MPDRPNILFIFTDQQRADTLACYGNTLIHTPNLNSLADGSFVFENAYVSTPICAPSRSTIMTGTWPHTNGLVKNNIPLNPSVQTIAEMLPEEYLTANFGKWHLGDEVIRQHSFDRWVSIEDDSSHRKFYSDPRYLSVFSDYHHFLIEKGFKPDMESEGAMIFSQPYAAALPEEYTKAMFLGDEAARFIHDNRDRPFALYVSIFEPHPPYNGPFNNLHDPQLIPVNPVFMKDPPDNATQLHKFRVRETQMGGGFDEDISGRLDEAYWRALVARYWGLVTLVDGAVGRILGALEEAGVADNTIVVYTSDHGDQLGDHNIIHKSCFYEQSIKVPLLMRVPWLGERQTLIEGRYSQIDLVPTLLDLVGADIPGHLQGESRAAVLRGEATLEGNDVIIDWTGRVRIPTHPSDQELVQSTQHRTLISADGWKLTLALGYQGELYDLNTDPYEDTNLFDEPTHRARIREMSARIRKWQRRTEDPAQLPDV